MRACGVTKWVSSMSVKKNIIFKEVFQRISSFYQTFSWKEFLSMFQSIYIRLRTQKTKKHRNIIIHTFIYPQFPVSFILWITFTILCINIFYIYVKWDNAILTCKHLILIPFPWNISREVINLNLSRPCSGVAQWRSRSQISWLWWSLELWHRRASTGKRMSLKLRLSRKADESYFFTLYWLGTVGRNFLNYPEGSRLSLHNQLMDGWKL